MTGSTTRWTTFVPRRYLGQLCKHFENTHALPVTLADTRGRVEFPFGACVLEVETDTLVLRAEAPDAAGLAATERMMTGHVQRAAFRDPPELIWEPAPVLASV